MRIGIFGGSFDPVHVGHEAFVRRAMQELKLDKIFIVPVFLSPFKVDAPPKATPEDRVAMVKLAFFEDKGVEILTYEIEKKGVSYTIDTVRYMVKKFPKEEMFLLLTEEARPSFYKWKDVEEIRKLVQVVFLGPRGIENSTEIRKGVEKCKEFLSTKVLDYIEKHHLYFT